MNYDPNPIKCGVFYSQEEVEERVRSSWYFLKSKIFPKPHINGEDISHKDKTTMKEAILLYDNLNTHYNVLDCSVFTSCSREGKGKEGELEAGKSKLGWCPRKYIKERWEFVQTMVEKDVKMKYFVKLYGSTLVGIFPSKSLKEEAIAKWLDLSWKT